MRQHMHLRRFTMIVAVGVFIAGCTSPPLTETDAAQIISRTPQFNNSRRMVKLVSAHRSSPESYCCYDVLFTFQRIGSNQAPVTGHAEFRYWGGKWHLQQFYYDEPGGSSVTTVLVESAEPGTQKTTKYKNGDSEQFPDSAPHTTRHHPAGSRTSKA